MNKNMGDYMKFHGSITFDIIDEKDIDVDFGVDIIPTKTIKKGDLIFRGGGEEGVCKPMDV